MRAREEDDVTDPSVLETRDDPAAPHAGVVRAAEGKTMRVLGDAITLKARGRDGAWSIFLGEAPANVGPPRHRHPWDENYYITSGTLEVLVDETWSEAHPGDLVVIPAGVPHTFHGRGGKAEFVIFVAPGGVEAMFEEFDRDAPELPPVIEKVVAIAARHRVEAVGPVGR
jgi:mannose-6-phosphate isomerase-like protein (cupin superfamily)